MDKIGVRLGLVLFTIFVTIGQCIFTWGGYAENFNIMLVGRIVYALGGECMCVAQSTIVSQWFKGKEMNTAMGLNLTVARMGSVIAGFVLPPMFLYRNSLGDAFIIGSGLCIFSFGCAIGIVILDKAAENQEKGATVAVSDEDKFTCSDILKFGIPFWCISMSCMLTYMSVFPYN